MLDLELFLLESEIDNYEIIEEASFVIDRNRLNDEDYVKELIDDLQTPYGSKIKITPNDVITITLLVSANALLIIRPTWSRAVEEPLNAGET